MNSFSSLLTFYKVSRQLIKKQLFVKKKKQEKRKNAVKESRLNANILKKNFEESI